MRPQTTLSLGCVLVASLLAACSATLSGVKQSENFKQADIIAGGMAIAGVASSFEELSERDANRIATNLQISIQEEREKYPLTPMPEVRNTMGREAYQKMMAEYALDGLLSPERLGQVGSALKTRYLTLVRIESDTVSDPNWSHVPDRKDSQGRVLERERIEVAVRRELKVTAQVYDLRGGESVWSGLVTTWDSELKAYPIQKESGAQALVALIQAARGQPTSQDDRTTVEKYPPPAPPPLYRMLPNVFEKFAGSLPK